MPSVMSSTQAQLLLPKSGFNHYMVFDSEQADTARREIDRRLGESKMLCDKFDYDLKMRALYCDALVIQPGRTKR